MVLGASVGYRLARLLTLTVGGFAIAWALWSWWSPPVAMGWRIVSGEVFRTDALEQGLKALESRARATSCDDPTVLQSIAIVRLRLIGQEPSRTQANDNELANLRTAIDRSLACSPADSYLWLILYWVSDKLTEPSFEYLRMSYQLGPNEGWIAATRNRVALSVIDKLPPDLAEAVINEFSGLVASGFDDAAADSLGTASSPVRDRLLSRLSAISERQRRDFAKTLNARGYDLAVPGVTAPRLRPGEARPWD
jgi:hypothetical protein